MAGDPSKTLERRFLSGGHRHLSSDKLARLLPPNTGQLRRVELLGSLFAYKLRTN